MNYKITKRSKMLYLMSSIVSKTSPRKFPVFFQKNLRIFQDPGSGLVNDLGRAPSKWREVCGAAMGRGPKVFPSIMNLL